MKPVVIEVMNGPEDGREIICGSFPISIGRENENTVDLHCDHLVSRNHARITQMEGGLFLSDLGSTNGTFIGKKRVREDSPIKPGKLFRVGATLLRVKPHAPDAESE